jgi:hypothetical protein
MVPAGRWNGSRVMFLVCIALIDGIDEVPVLPSVEVNVEVSTLIAVVPPGLPSGGSGTALKTSECRCLILVVRYTMR